MIKVNDKITLVFWTSKGELVVRARVLELEPRFDLFKWRSSKDRHQDGILALSTEGTEWCRGWRGPPVKALRAVVVLRSA